MFPAGRAMASERMRRCHDAAIEFSFIPPRIAAVFICLRRISTVESYRVFRDNRLTRS
jgi:hypothetical protein